MRFMLLLHLLLILLTFSVTGKPLPEYQALLSLKTTITSDPHSSLSTWNISTNQNHCTWSGITCDSHRHVISLNLSSLNLTGTLSPDLSSLRFLQNLSLAVNQFSGSLPESLNSLSSLRSLNLSNNIFNGTLPSFKNLISLEILDLYNNNFDGALPVDIYNLSSLRHLHLGGNFFSGAIPAEYGRFAALEYLAVSGNELSGVIPPELDAADCGLSGEIPRELEKLQNLDTLFLQVNEFSGAIRSELGNLKNLKSIDLSNNLLSGEIPESFANLKNLTLLNLFRNQLHGSIPDLIAELPELEVLQLWDNNFTGNVPQELGKNSKLRFVDISSNKLTGLLPPGLCSGNKLDTLITLENYLLGPIPDSLGECTSLSRIRMGENYLNGSIPKGIMSLPQLTQLELQDNLLSGEFPETDYVSVKLGEVNLSSNHLTGSLPATIGKFVGVQKLLLVDNKFSGQIPPEIGRLRQLSQIDLSQNTFSGEIPKDISKCQLLTFVDLSRNQLTGGIPTEITNMRILNYLNLSRNHLVGSIPATIAAMQSLTSVDFSYNNFSGLVPGTGQFSYFNYTSFLGNPELCGPYLGPCKDGDSNGHHSHRLSASMKLLLVIGLLVCSIAFAVAAVFKARSLKKSSGARAWKLTAFQRLDFTCDDVLDCLKEDNIIGKGGAGIVYKGVMPNNVHVAVKRLPVMSRGSSHDHGFNAEIQTLGRIRHRHIVRLLGFCSNHETNLLVYEFMPNGSLGETLHGKKGGHLLWGTRYKIAVEAAKGLCYLHHDCSPLILHRDVKSNNILLDSNFEAHVADFGLAKFLQDSDTSECMSAIAGSYGYIAPEYAYTLKVDEKSDVYSFGVVLLELVSGKKPVGEFGDGVDIVQWVRMLTDGNKEEVSKILDSRLSTVALDEVMHVFYVALLCVQEHAMERPTMREVVQILTELPRPHNSKQGDSVDSNSSLESPSPSSATNEQHQQSPRSPTADLLSI
ncbi:hypothetical protein AgCh_012662 [Apium graveolens]